MGYADTVRGLRDREAALAQALEAAASGRVETPFAYHGTFAGDPEQGFAQGLPAIEKAGGVAVITADHGNADCMWTEKNGKRSPHVAHTLNPVPFIIKDYSGANAFRMRDDIATPGLSNVAATLLNLMTGQRLRGELVLLLRGKGEADGGE